MPDLTRRGFLRGASVGAAAIGALGLLPTLVDAEGTNPVPSSAAAARSPGPASTMAIAGGSALPMPVVVVFDDLASGKGRVFIGEQEVEFDNTALVQSVQMIVG